MDQAPAALGNILESAFAEIREEVNELKQSNVSLQSRADASEKQLTDSSAKVGQLERALYRTVLNAADQKKAAHHLRVSVAEARNEIAALQLLLTAKDEPSSMKNGTRESEEPLQHEDPVITSTEEQPTEFFSFSSTSRPPPLIREPSSASSMTFCDAEQSVARRNHRALGLQDRAVPISLHLQVPMARPDEGILFTTSNHKRRKTMASQASLFLREESSPDPLTKSALAHRPRTSVEKESVVPCLTEHTFGEIDTSVLDEDVHMEDDDNIIVAVRWTRTAFALGKSPPKAATASESGKAVDAVLREIDVTSPARESNLATRPESQSPKAGASRKISEVAEPDTGLEHQPQNRGENDQTGEPDECVYQTVRLDDGNLYTVDRSRAHVNKPQAWKSWAVKKSGSWYQWSSYATLDWADKKAIETMNNWRGAAFIRAGFPKKRPGRREGALVAPQAPMESDGEERMESQVRRAAPVGPQASSQTPPGSVSRSLLLSQFQPRTSKTQKASQSQSGESD